MSASAVCFSKPLGSSLLSFRYCVRRQQTGRDAAVRVAEDALVDLHLVGGGELGVVRLELRRVGVVVVAHDRPVAVQGTGLEDDAAVAVPDDDVQPRAASRICGRQLVTPEILHRDLGAQPIANHRDAGDADRCRARLQVLDRVVGGVRELVRQRGDVERVAIAGSASAA